MASSSSRNNNNYNIRPVFHFPQHNMISFEPFSIPIRTDSNIHFRPHPLAILNTSLTFKQTCLLDNLWFCRSNDKALGIALNCLIVTLNENNMAQSKLRSDLELVQQKFNETYTNNELSKISLVPKTPANLEKVSIKNLERRIEELKNELILEKEKNKKLEENINKSNLDLDYSDKCWTELLEKLTKDNILQQYQHIYFPQIDEHLKGLIFTKIKKAKKLEQEECLRDIFEAYNDPHNLENGIVFSSKDIRSQQNWGQCEYNFCQNGFHMVYISINLEIIQHFREWSVQQLLDFGFLGKVIICGRNSQELTHQLNQFHHPELRRLLRTILTSSTSGMSAHPHPHHSLSMTLIIHSIGPAYLEITDDAKHVIEIIKTPRYHAAAQMTNLYQSPVNTEDIRSTLHYLRLYDVAHARMRINKDNYNDSLLYQDKHMMVFCHHKHIFEPIFNFQFLVREQDSNSVEHLSQIHPWNISHSGDHSEHFLSTQLPSIPPPEEDDWVEPPVAIRLIEYANDDDVERHNIENRLEP